MSLIEQFISDLTPNNMQKIRYPELLISSLKELDKMVEMFKVKQAVIQQIKYYLIAPSTDDCPIHAVICGPPGVGKTRIGTILSKILYSIGIVTGKPVPNNRKRGLELKLGKVYKYFQSQRVYVNEMKKHYKHKKRIYPREILADIKELEENIEDIEILFKTKEEPKDVTIKIVGREDFVGNHIGDTALKTKDLLNENLGRVLFIDEAYLLYTDEKDSFGLEALTVLNRFMSEHSREIVVILGGYKELLEKTIFTAQPGLRRRCFWIFEVEKYSSGGLSQIFRQQMEDEYWKIDKKVNLEKFFDKYKDSFPNYGGDTLRLARQCRLIYSGVRFKDKRKNYLITEDILVAALDEIKANTFKEKESTHLSMFL